MKTRFKRILVFALVMSLALSFPGLGGSSPALAASFSDTENHWAKDAISRWVDNGVLQGVGGGRFLPNSDISRAEFLTILNRVFGATATADISRFADVSKNKWYYNQIAVAYRMGTSTGTSSNTMSPDAPITREEAAVTVARALYLSSSESFPLNRFTDAVQISSYAVDYLSAMVDSGYINGLPNGTFNPKGNLKRAEAVTILDNIISKFYSAASSNESVTGSYLTAVAGSKFSGLSITGDLIIGDGVGAGDVEIAKSTINGRLIIRGGGPNSVKISGTTVTEGVYVNNPNGDTHIVLSDGSKLGDISAQTGLYITGEGADSLTVAKGAADNTLFKLENANLKTLDIRSPRAKVELVSGSVNSVTFYSDGNDSSMNLAEKTTAENVKIDANNITITGKGAINVLDINKPGANVAMSPKTLNIANNISATVAGKTEKGRDTSRISNVSRPRSDMAISRDGDYTGGYSLNLTTRVEDHGNSVTITQSGGTVKLSDQRRLGYWIGLFIPSPTNYTSPRVYYEFDGSESDSRRASLVTLSNKRGIEVLVPVTRRQNSLKGDINQQLYIDWGNSYYEELKVSASGLDLEQMSSGDESEIVRYYRNAIFYASTGTYYGSEAIRRLLASDNALGLSTQNFVSLPLADQDEIAKRIYDKNDRLTNRTAIQDLINIEVGGRGALYAINRAANAQQVKNIIETSEFESQMNIDFTDASKYYTLSQVGRLHVARMVLLARGTDFPDEASLKTLFNQTVNAVRILETNLLDSINSVKAKEELTKIIENKSNAELMNISIDNPPYKTFTAEQKSAIMAEIFKQKPYTSLDQVSELILSYTSGSKPTPTPDPTKDNTISSVSANQSSITLVMGSTYKIIPTITTPSGTYSDPKSVTWSIDKSNIATVAETDGTVTAMSKGTSKLTITAVKDTKKKATVTINVVDEIKATDLSLNRTIIEVAEGGTAMISATKTPATSTDEVVWSSDDPAVATIANGKVTGIKPGMTGVSARVGDIQASCTVIVVGKDNGIALYPNKETVGIGMSKKLTAVVSPITLSNRSVKWASSNPGLVTVDATGKITGLAVLPNQTRSTVTITATSSAFPDKSASCTVTVDSTIKGIVINSDNLTMYKGGEIHLTAKVVPSLAQDDVVIWSLDVKNTTTAKMEDELVTQANLPPNTSTNGAKISAIGAGKGVILASLQNDPSVSTSINLEVLSSQVKMTLSTKTLSLKTGEKKLLTTSLTPVDLQNKEVRYVSRDASIVTVDQTTGLVTAVAPGSTWIDVTPLADTTQVQTCAVTVVSNIIPVKSMTLPAKTTMSAGDKVKFSATISPDNATNKNIQWSIEDMDKLELTSDGYLFGKKTTYKMERVIVPDPTEPSGTRVDDMLVDHPIKLIATLLDGDKTYTATCMVTIEPHDGAPGVENIRILMDTWVYPVGYTQNMHVEFNCYIDADHTKAPNIVEGKPDPKWQPANTKVSWTSSNPTVAKINSATGYMEALQPGVTTLTAISEDGAIEDKKKVFIGAVAIKSLALTGLDTDYTYGSWTKMDLSPSGSKKTIGVTVDPQLNTDKRMIWTSVNVTPKDDGSVTPVTVTNESDKFVRVDSNGNLTAQKPGLAMITITPLQTEAYGVVKPSDPLVAISMKDPAYPKGPAKNPNIPYDSIMQPDPNIPKPLLIKNEITDGSNVFYVWVTPTAVNSVVLAEPVSKTILTGDTVALQGNISPSHTTVSALTWSVTRGGAADNGATVTLTPGQTASGIAPATVTGVSPGTVTVGLKVDSPEGLGRYPVLSIPGMLQQKYDAATKSADPQYTIEVKPRPISSVTVVPGATGGSVSGFAGDVITVRPVIEPSNPYSSELTWSSDNPGVATVSQTAGVVSVTFVSAGTANISAKPTAAESASAAVTSLKVTCSASPAITALSITDSSGAAITTLNLTEKTEIKVKPTPASASSAVTWSFSEGGGAPTATSDKLEVLTSSGTIYLNPRAQTALDTPVVLKATSTVTNTTVATLSVTVPGGFTPSLLMSPDSAPVSLTTVPSLKAAVPQPETFVSSNTSVATVSSTGVVTPVSAGEAVITVASADGKKSAQVDVVIEKTAAPAQVKSIKIRSSLTLANGDAVTLTPAFDPVSASSVTIDWSSSNPAVASISQSGTVTAAAPGKATITAKLSGGKLTAKCTVTIVAAPKTPVSSISFKTATALVAVGGTASVPIVFAPTSATIKGVTYASSDPSIIKVDFSGKLTGVAPGTATITAISDNGAKTAVLTVTSHIPVSKLKLSAATLKLTVGASSALTASIEPANATNKALTWTSSNAAIATVDKDGNIKAIKAGSATIKAVTADGKKSASCKVTVTK